MDNEQFVNYCKELVYKYTCKELIYKYTKENMGKGITFTKDDVYVVWLSKTLQNNKSLLSTNVSDGMYYEVTYNGDKKEAYFDVYKKQENIKYSLPKEKSDTIVR